MKIIQGHLAKKWGKNCYFLVKMSIANRPNPLSVYRRDECSKRRKGQTLFQELSAFFVSQMKTIDEEMGRLYHWEYCGAPRS